ncbi:MAG: hypothetical protein SGPRY_010915, partial [Prymnesium sp.]
HAMADAHSTSRGRRSLSEEIHTFSVGSALAICRMLPPATAPSFEQVLTLVEHARRKLVLCGSSLVAAAIVTSHLLPKWQPNWQIAYLIGLSIGAKFTTEGFFLSDVFQHVTQNFPLIDLKRCELAALDLIKWSELTSGFMAYRNVLSSIALNQQSSQMPNIPLAPQNILLNASSESELKVIVLHSEQAAITLSKQIHAIDKAVVFKKFT